MRLLLDTHVAIWVIAKTSILPRAIIALITNPSNTVWVSAVSVAEIAIKSALSRSGLGAMPYSASEAITRFEATGFELLSLSPGHALALEGLPPIHRDPFDRLLVAQALDEPMRLVTRDAQVAAYSQTFIHF